MSECSSRSEDLHLSVCAVLIVEACNIGPEPLVQPGRAGLTRARLSWVEQNYLRADTLTAANARLMDAQIDIDLARAWVAARSPAPTGCVSVTCVIAATKRGETSAPWMPPLPGLVTGAEVRLEHPLGVKAIHLPPPDTGSLLQGCAYTVFRTHCPIKVTADAIV